MENKYLEQKPIQKFKPLKDLNFLELKDYLMEHYLNKFYDVQEVNEFIIYLEVNNLKIEKKEDIENLFENFRAFSQS